MGNVAVDSCAHALFFYLGVRFVPFVCFVVHSEKGKLKGEKMNELKLNIDDGLLRLNINGNGVIEFNPSDPNVYHRFIGLVNDLPKIQKEYQEYELPENTNDEIGVATATLEQLNKIDMEMKSRLSAVFGRGTDFDVLLGGASLMGFGNNGERVITNLLNALTPYMQEGLQRHMNAKAIEAMDAAEKRRTQMSQ